MRELLGKAGIVLSSLQLDQLWSFHQRLRANNEDRDLTRIVGFENIVIKHYIDCMIVGGMVPLPQVLLDIGTGAGFPGIPLKIRYPKTQFILAEHRPGRVAFLEETIRALKLDGIEVFPHQVTSKTFAQPTPGVITRALEPIEKTLLRTTACTGAGARFLFMKGPGVDAELQHALRRFRGKFSLEADRAYTLPNTTHERRLVVVVKSEENP